MHYAIGFLVVVLLAGVFALWKTGLLAKLLAKPQSKLPYRKKDYLLTRAERSFYEVLVRAASDMLVFPKIRVLDLVCLAKGTQNAQVHRNRVQAKHVDFVLCRRDTLSPELVVELNDSSHEQHNRRERDAFLGEVFNAAGIAFLRVPARQGYDTRELSRQIQGALAPTPSGTVIR